MKAALQTIVGLVFDDWWLFAGVIVSIIGSYAGLKAGIGAQVSGWILVILVSLALILSLWMEFRRKAKRISHES